MFNLYIDKDGAELNISSLKSEDISCSSCSKDLYKKSFIDLTRFPYDMEYLCLNCAENNLKKSRFLNIKNISEKYEWEFIGDEYFILNINNRKSRMKPLKCDLYEHHNKDCTNNYIVFGSFLMCFNYIREGVNLDKHSTESTNSYSQCKYCENFNELENNKEFGSIPQDKLCRYCYDDIKNTLEEENLDSLLAKGNLMSL